MSDPSPFGEEKTKEGFFAKLLRRAARPELGRVVKRTEELRLIVPTAKADAVETAVDRWLAGRGITATMTREDAGDDKTHLRASLGGDDAAKLDLSSDAIQDELEKLITDAADDAPG
jgi:hypothetical protein